MSVSALASVPSQRPLPDDLETARGVIVAEAAGLQALADLLDDSFVQAVAVIDRMRQARRGRLIIAGIGKSGHVGRKISATLASTGTPSYYVHPGEASHGDLGMITEDDIVIMISNSGEVAEQGDLIAYVKRFGIPLIGITRAPGSTLGKASDILLRLPQVPEAGPNGLAPTTSTTMTMALGDALAMALLRRSGLTPEQFKVFHPGGKLGRQLLQVRDLMLLPDRVPLVPPDMTMDAAIVCLTEKNVGSVIVVDGSGALLGIVTDGDLKRHMGPDLLTKRVSEVMTQGPQTISSDLLAAAAMNQMVDRSGGVITALVVIEEGRVAGLIRLQDCLQAGLA